MKINNDSYFLLFANCIIVKGYKKTIICDLQRNSLIDLNESQLKIINLLEKTKVNDLINSVNEGSKTYILDLINYLVEKDIGFITNNRKLYPKLNLGWTSPFIITNAIIDINYEIPNLITDNLYELITLNCPNIQFRLFKIISFSQINDLLKFTIDSRVQSIEILFPFDKDNFNFDSELRQLVDNNLRITKIIVYGATESIQIIYRSFIILFTEKLLNSIKFCGVVQKIGFNLNIENFTESQSFNSCLNRKISVDVDGNIKNCPSMEESYGNIMETTLAEAIEKPGFKKYWDLNKDKIHVCKDCEFRYICTDCRAYVENPDDILSKPLKCGYNPYIGEWSKWSTNPIKQKSIKYYKIEETGAC